MIGTPRRSPLRWREHPPCYPDLDEEIGPSRPGVEFLGRGEGAGRVMGQQGRDFQRHPAVDAVGLVVDRPKQIGGLPEVLQRQLEEQRLADLTSFNFPRIASS